LPWSTAELASSSSIGPDRITIVRGDVTDPDVNRTAVELAQERFGGLDAFVGNAGVHDGGRGLLDLELDELAELIDRVMAVNVRGYLLGARAAAAAVAERRGCMVFTLSDASFRVSGVGAGVVYATSKHAGVGIVRTLAAQLAPDVRVNAVAPGGVLTNLRAVEPGRSEGRGLFTTPAAVERQVRSVNPLGTMLTAEQLVSHYLYLLSSESAGLTGHILRPDGGLEAT
jgi:2,3-dihydroxy-2,3-dihydrophenylpropionate dehydrogenase